MILTVLLASFADSSDDDAAKQHQQQQSVLLAPLAKSCDTVYGLVINTVNPHFTNKNTNSAMEEKEESCIQVDNQSSLYQQE
eukprot:5339031-Ditylum_brightwellii.AAC.1